MLATFLIHQEDFVLHTTKGWRNMALCKCFCDRWSFVEAIYFQFRIIIRCFPWFDFKVFEVKFKSIYIIRIEFIAYFLFRCRVCFPEPV